MSPIIAIALHPRSQYGDLYKVTLEHDGDKASELKVKYFDTIPTCQSIAVLKSGFLFAASEVRRHGPGGSATILWIATRTSGPS